MVYLLDVNVLLAFCDHHHIHHEAAHRWFLAKHGRQWATCPITENGFVRILGNPNYPNSPGNSGAALEMLRQVYLIHGHHFWADTKSILDMTEAGVTFGSKQITDLYLLGLAAAEGGKLATFDRKIPSDLIRGGAKALELLG